MQSFRRRFISASLLAAAATVSACSSESPSAPEREAPHGTSTSGQSGGDSDAVGLSVTPGTLVVHVGGSATLVAAVVDASGGVVRVPAEALPWTSSNTSVVTVTGAGVVTAVGAGEATVSTTVGAFTGSARVLVSR